MDADIPRVATQDIEPEEPLFSIPRHMVILPETSSLPKETLAAIREGLEGDEWSVDILTMIYEHHLGSGSRWEPYFNILPEEFDTPIFWTEDELSELQASGMRESIGKEAADEGFYSTLLPIIRSQLVSLSAVPDEELLRRYHRMASTIMAYAFDVAPPSSQRAADDDGWFSEDEDENLPKGMVPLADMLNADADRNNARLFYEEDKLVMQSIKPIQSGEEIFNDYGPLPRSELLRRYGYVSSRYRKYDNVFLSPGVVFEAAKKQAARSEEDVEARTTYLEELGLEDPPFVIQWPGDDPSQPGWILSLVGKELAVAVAILALRVEEFHKMRSRDKAPDPDRLASRVSADESAMFCRILLGAVEAQSAAYPTALESDLEMLARSKGAKSELSKRNRMALEVRIGEKEILARAAGGLRTVLCPEPDSTSERLSMANGNSNAAGEAQEGRPSSKRQRVG